MDYYEDKVIISRNTLGGLLTQGVREDRIFFYKDLYSVKYRKPTFFTNGYINLL